MRKEATGPSMFVRSRRHRFSGAVHFFASIGTHSDARAFEPWINGIGLVVLLRTQSRPVAGSLGLPHRLRVRHASNPLLHASPHFLGESRDTQTMPSHTQQ